MKLVYVAGPYRASTPWQIEQNVRFAEAMSLEVWRLGAAAVCPHANCRYFQNELPDQVFLDGTLEMMRRCDAMLVVGAWGRSDGSKKEIHEASLRGIPTFYTVGELREWLERENHRVGMGRSA